MTNFDMYDSFARYIDNIGSENTAKVYKRRVKSYLDFLNATGMNIEDATPGIIADWISGIRNTANNRYNGTKVSDVTKKQAKAAVTSFYDYLKIHHIVSANPATETNMRFVIHNKEKKALTSNMIKEMVNLSSSLRDKAMILTIASTGMRISEITNILFTEYIHMRENNLNYITIMGKGRKPRNVIFSNEVIKAIDKYIMEQRDDRGMGCEYLFLSNRGNQVDAKVFSSVLKHTAKKAGVPYWEEISNHWLRVSCATNMAKHNVDIKTIATILGHSNISTTNTYLKATMEDMQDAVASISFM